MVALRLAHYNTKRLLRRKWLRIALLTIPLAVALPRVIFPGISELRYAALLTPVVCALLIGAVVHAQWSVDAASGLVAGLKSCPISRRALVVSRILSGASILAVQMVVFGAILLVRF